MNVVDTQPRRGWRAYAYGILILALGGAGLIALSTALGYSTAARAQIGSAAPSFDLTSSAYLYRFDPTTSQFITLSLPLDSRPSAVTVVTGAIRDNIWYAAPGLNQIGRVVYTSTTDYVLTEYAAPGAPQAIAASPTDVWFTLPTLGQVGHLNPVNGTVVTVSLIPISSTLSDIAVDSIGQAWLAQRSGDQVLITGLSSTLGVSMTLVITPANSNPGGLAIDHDDQLWLAAKDSDLVWRVKPVSGTIDSPIVLSGNSYPDRLAHNDASNYLWVALTKANQLGRWAGAVPESTELYTIPMTNSLPGALAVDHLDHVYFVQQATNQLGRLTITPTVAFDDYALPRRDLKATGLAIGQNNAVWVAAYREVSVYRQFLPWITRYYDRQIPSFGVQMYWAISPQYGLTRVLESQTTWVRYPVFWSGIEPTNTTPDKYNWAATDASLLAARDSNLKLIVTLGGNPSWATPSGQHGYGGPVQNIADLQEFVGAIVARYPHVKYWEFYNEPDNWAWFGLQGAAYANMLKAVYPVVKAANPDAQVVMGGLAMDWFIEQGGPFDRNFLQDVLANCSGPCFDLANFHYYPSARAEWEPYGRDIIGKANYVRQMLATYHYTRTVINTETGWPNISISGGTEIAARWLPKVYVRGLAAGLPTVIWYSLLDSDSSLPGLLDLNLTPRPTYDALRALTGLMNTAHFVRTIPVTETGSSFIEGYQFSVIGTNGSKRLDVYWYDCPSMSLPGFPFDCNDVAPLQIRASRLGKSDKFGNRVIVDDADDGYRDGLVTLGVLSSPIYIDYEP